MKYLLDTHVAIWSVADARRLPTHIADLLANPDNDVRVSIVNLFEIAIKNAPGRRDRMPVSVDEAVRYFSEAAYEMLPIGTNHTAVLENLPTSHGDPFDRMLVSQAVAEGMLLITQDKTLRLYGNMVLVF